MNDLRDRQKTYNLKELLRFDIGKYYSNITKTRYFFSKNKNKSTHFLLNPSKKIYLFTIFSRFFLWQITLELKSSFRGEWLKSFSGSMSKKVRMKSWIALFKSVACYFYAFYLFEKYSDIIKNASSLTTFKSDHKK